MKKSGKKIYKIRVPREDSLLSGNSGKSSSIFLLMSRIQTESFDGVWKGVTKLVQYGYNSLLLFCKSCANSEKDMTVVLYSFIVNTNEWLGERNHVNKLAFVLVYIDKTVYEYFHHIYQY